MITMPERNSVAEQIVRAASKCLRTACAAHFELVPLDSVTQIVSGGTPDTSNPSYWDGDIVWITPKDLGRPRDIEITDSERRVTQSALAESAARLLPAGTVLFSSRAPIGHIGIANVDLCTNQGFKNIICSERVNNRYLFHMLRASIEVIQAHGRGNTFLEIPAKVLKEYEVPLPPFSIQEAVADFLDTVYLRASGQDRSLPVLLYPLDEQRRIVARIEELAAKIEQARGLRREAIEEARAVLAAAMQVIWSAHVGWPQQRLGELAQTVSGQVDPTIEPYCDLPHINGEAIESGTAKLLQYRRAQDDGVTSGKYHFRAASILYSKIRPYLRKAVQVPVEGICSADVYAFDWIDPGIEPRFLMYSLIAPPFSEYAHRLSGRTRMPKLNLEQLYAFQLGFPEPVEQRRIVEYLDSLQAKVDAVKALQAETEAELNALLPAVLDRAFRGEL